MKLYLDCEFNGHGGELISMALIGREPRMRGEPWRECQWYEARGFIEGTPVDSWVAEHVLPKVGTRPLLREQFRMSFHEFIRRLDNPEIICDFHIDAAHFSQMLSGPDYQSSLDFAYRITVLKTPPGQPVSKNPHNALADAIALMEWHGANQ